MYICHLGRKFKLELGNIYLPGSGRRLKLLDDLDCYSVRETVTKQHPAINKCTAPLQLQIQGFIILHHAWLIGFT